MESGEFRFKGGKKKLRKSILAEESRGKRPVRRHNIDGSIILKEILKKWVVRMSN